jgi:hypothetical protein
VTSDIAEELSPCDKFFCVMMFDSYWYSSTACSGETGIKLRGKTCVQTCVTCPFQRQLRRVEYKTTERERSTDACPSSAPSLPLLPVGRSAVGLSARRRQVMEPLSLSRASSIIGMPVVTLSSSLRYSLYKKPQQACDTPLGRKRHVH